MGKLTLHNVQKEVADGLNGAHFTFDSIFRTATDIMDKCILYTSCFHSVNGFTAHIHNYICMYTNDVSL